MMEKHTRISLQFRIIVGLVLICVVWGSTWAAIKIGLGGVPPFIGAGLRFAVASLIMAVYIAARRLTLPTSREFYLLCLSLSLNAFALPFALAYYAAQFIPSALASLLFAVYPFWVAIFAWIRLKNEPLGGAQWFGTLLGFIGILLIFSSELGFGADFTSSAIGMTGIVLSAILQANSVISIRKKGGGYHPVTLTFFSIFFATIFLLLLSLFAEDWSSAVWTTTSVGAIIYLGSFGTVATFVTYFWLLRYVHPVLLALTAFVTPILAILFGVLLLDEQLGAEILYGGVLVLIGILVANINGIRALLIRRRALDSIP